MEKHVENHAELYAHSRRLLLHPNMRCEDCEHFSATDGCWMAAEALVMLGYPRAPYSVEFDDSAESCPDFERSDNSRNSEAVAGWVWENRVDAAHAEGVGK